MKENATIMCCFLVITVLTLSIKIIRIDTESIIVTNYVIDERFYKKFKELKVFKALKK